MGLDMYLYRAKRVKDVTPRQLVCVNEYFIYLERPDKYKDSTMKQWCGIDVSEVDMSLVEDYRSEYVKRFYSWDTGKEYGHNSIIEMIADWRKANHIHKWFVDNVQNGEDDCWYYEVTREQLEVLLETCKTVINDFRLAESLLPTTSGFFFGSTDYNKWYLEDVEHTIEVVENLLDTTDFENEMIMYHSSW